MSKQAIPALIETPPKNCELSDKIQLSHSRENVTIADPCIHECLAERGKTALARIDLKPENKH